jgi:hypothetical protein
LWKKPLFQLQPCLPTYGRQTGGQVIKRRNSSE